MTVSPGSFFPVNFWKPKCLVQQALVGGGGGGCGWSLQLAQYCKKPEL